MEFIVVLSSLSLQVKKDEGGLFPLLGVSLKLNNYLDYLKI